MNKVIGIDLGTTNSVVSVMEFNQPVVISNSEGLRTNPSVVAYTKTGSCVVGRVAKRQAVVNPQNTFYSIKRFIGNTYDSVKDEVKQVAYQVTRDSNNSPKMQCPILGQQLSPENLSAQILKKLVDDAERYLGDKVTQAVITTPSYFNDAQRQATKNAGKLAGLEVLKIINEPTAAALAYGLHKEQNQTIIVFDLGGGTLDVSILKIGDNVFEVLATCGDTHLGGDDFTNKIVEYVVYQFYRNEGVNLWLDKQALQRIIEAAEQAKIDLSNSVEANINIPFVTMLDSVPKHLQLNLTRKEFNSITQELRDRCRIVIKNSIQQAKISMSDIDQVILVGGSTRIIAIQELLHNTFSKPLNYSINPDEAIALGAAVQGGLLAGEVKDVLLLDVTPFNLGVETLGGVMTTIIPCNTTIPTKKSETFSTAANGQTNVEIHIIQGNREMAADNKSLGIFRLDGIPPAPQGTPQIEVVFDIDANGILNVQATDLGTGKEMNITVTELSFNSLHNLNKESLATNVKSLEKTISELSPEINAKVSPYIQKLKNEVDNLSVDKKVIKINAEQTMDVFSKVQKNPLSDNKQLINNVLLASRIAREIWGWMEI